MIPKVFISYSHDSEEHRNWVLQLATRLRANGVDAVLDRWNLSLGSDLASFMENGLSDSNRVICICSDKYLLKANKKTNGVGYEKQIMTAELMENIDSNWIIPLVRNNSSSKLPNFLRGRLYINFGDESKYELNYEELLRDLLDEKILSLPLLGENPFKVIKNYSNKKFVSSSEKYCSPALFGKVTFDYSNNNGKYFIGQGELMFELYFSKASDTSIHLYNHTDSVNTIALVKDVNEIYKIKDATLYDTSSDSRTIKLNSLAVLQNKNGFYAVIKILFLKDDTRNDLYDEVQLEYKIQSNGSSSFDEEMI